MPEAFELLTLLAKDIEESGSELRFHEHMDIDYSRDGTIEVEFIGDSVGGSFLEFIEVLAMPEIAPVIRSVTIDTDLDAGINGVSPWWISGLSEGGVEYSNLTKFSIRRTEAGDHNHQVVENHLTGSEEGEIAKVVACMPNLRYLTVPSAPNIDFFNNGELSIRVLRVDAGFDTQDFIHNLANSKTLPHLLELEWGEYYHPYMADYKEHCTPFEHYVQLFESQALENVNSLLVRNPEFTEDQIAYLRKLKPQMRFVTVSWQDHE